MNVLDRLQNELDDEQQKVIAWRELSFLRLEAEPALAIALALTDVDLRAYEQLLERGATPELAARILR